MKKEITEIVTGTPAIDGAGVHLERVLSPETMRSFDPFLMLDTFDSTNPEDFTNGFPLHPHRGIEILTYLMKGRIDHYDSLNNRVTINDGESLWMTTGSGILHEEVPQPSEHLLGLQLWINLPAKEKMTQPKYFNITNHQIKEFEEDGTKIRLIAGKYKNHQGVKGPHLPITLLDIKIQPHKEFSFPVNPRNTLFIYIVRGKGYFGGKRREASLKSAVLFGKGDEFWVRSGEEGLHFFLAAAPPLKEAIAWGGPIIMNTEEELDHAFMELQEGSFVKESPSDIYAFNDKIPISYIDRATYKRYDIGYLYPSGL